MKKIIISISFIVIGFQAVCQHFQSAQTAPLAPTIYDSILVINSAWVEGGDFFKSSTTSISGDSITITNCYESGSSFGGEILISDTIKLGSLPAGTYYCTLYSRLYRVISVGIPPTPCDSLPNTDTFNFSFIVSEFGVGINEIGIYSINIYPNPSNDKIYISGLSPSATLTISDMTGRICSTPVGSEIDVSALPSGVYILHIRDSSGSVVRKFVKE